MHRLNCSNDKIKTSFIDSSDGSKQFNQNASALKTLLHIIELSYEGFYRAKSYTNAIATDSHHLEGNIQCVFYLKMLEEVLLTLEQLFNEMRAEDK